MSPGDLCHNLWHKLGPVAVGEVEGPHPVEVAAGKPL